MSVAKAAGLELNGLFNVLLRDPDEVVLRRLLKLGDTVGMDGDHVFKNIAHGASVSEVLVPRLIEVVQIVFKVGLRFLVKLVLVLIAAELKDLI